VYNKLDTILVNEIYTEKIFTIMKAQLPNDGREMQLSAAEGFLKCLEKYRTLKVPLQMELFNLTLTILGQWNTEVIDQWIKVFNHLIINLDWKLVKDRLTELVSFLSQASQPKQSRYAAVKVMVCLAQVY
jgi:hypothetical protein